MRNSRQQTDSRHSRLVAEITQEIEEASTDTRFPELRKLGDALNDHEAGKKLSAAERKKLAFAHRAQQRAFWCDRCQHVFTDGEVVYRKWDGGYRGMFGEGKPARLTSICHGCVQKLHPSWLEATCERVPCDGGCGVLVSGFSAWPSIRQADRKRYYRTCSGHCAEIALRERRRVHHDERACEVCGEKFLPMRADVRYCSGKCRTRAFRARQAST